VNGPTGLEIVQLPLGAYQANCYLVAREGGPEAVVIDPGDTPERVAGTSSSAAGRPSACS